MKYDLPEDAPVLVELGWRSSVFSLCHVCFRRGLFML